MITEQSSEVSKSNSTSINQRSKWSGGVVGYLIGCFAGGLIGWLIDSSLTSTPYAGVRIGAFVGGLCGGMIGAGTGWIGIGMVLILIVCSAAGVGASITISSPDPNSLAGIIFALIGGIVGAFIGLALVVLVIQRRKRGALSTEPDRASK